MIRKSQWAKFIYKWTKSQVSFPIFSAFFAPIRDCNIRCSYCYQVGAQEGIMSKEIFSKRLKFLLERGLTIVYFTGGEIMLWEHLNYALEKCKEYGLFTVIATNGILLTSDKIKRMSEVDLDYIMVSVDSDRFNPISLKSLEQNPQLIEMLKYAREKGIHVSCNAVLTKRNIPDVLALAETLSKSSIYLSIGFVDTKDIELSFQISTDKILLESVVTDIRSARSKGLLMLEPDSYFSDFAKHLEGGNTWRCSRERLKSLTVDPQGNFLVCTRLSDIISPTELRDSASIKELKKRISDILEGCNKSCYANCAYMSSYYQKHPLQFIAQARRELNSL